MVFLLYFIVSIFTFLYSYIWTDLAIILMTAETKPWIVEFFTNQNSISGNKILLSNIFLLLVFIFTLIQILLVFGKGDNQKLLKVGFVSSLVFALSFPFLSKDLFSYLFGAKIFWLYRQNPYLVIPETYRDIDLWLGFTHWTHREYVYGPVALIFSVIPMAIAGASRFLLNFFGYKILNWIVFLVTGYLLFKNSKNKAKALYIWFFNPLLIFEFLINSHNDLLMVGFFVISVIYSQTQRKIVSFVGFILSIATKYVSTLFFPLIIAGKSSLPLISKVYVGAMLFAFGLKFGDIQPWYYTWIYFALPFANFKKTSLILIFSLQALILVFKYLPFVKTTFWDGIPAFEDFYFVMILIPIVILLIEARSMKRKLWGLLFSKNVKVVLNK